MVFYLHLYDQFRFANAVTGYPFCPTFVRGGGDPITREAYEEIGGVGGALAQHAEATLERMRAAGVELIGDVRDEPYGRLIVFRDVAGNRWDLLESR